MMSDRVAVRRALRDDIHADDARGARTVVRRDLHAHLLRELLSDDAAEDVATRRRARKG